MKFVIEKSPESKIWQAKKEEADSDGGSELRAFPPVIVKESRGKAFRKKANSSAAIIVQMPTHPVWTPASAVMTTASS